MSDHEIVLESKPGLQSRTIVGGIFALFSPLSVWVGMAYQNKGLVYMGMIFSFVGGLMAIVSRVFGECTPIQGVFRKR